MKILQISSARGFGGGERQLLSLTRGLRERGHEVHVALDPDSPLGRALTRDAAAVPCLRAGRLNVAAVRNLARFVRERGVEVVHAHVGRDYPRAAAAVRLSRSLARLVLTRHVLFPMSRINRITLANASRVIAVSEAAARALRARRIFPDEKIRVVHNGVDFEAWARATARVRPRRDETLRVGIIGELSEVKGQADFVRAAAVVARRSTRETEFLIVGEDHSGGGQREALARLVSDLGLGSSIRLLGWRDDVEEILPTFDVLVSASSSEAFGMTLVEAMACGVAVVATATEGACEVVTDRETGLLVPVGGVEALAAAVLELLENPARRAELSERALVAARARFDVERMVEATARVYEEALGRAV